MALSYQDLAPLDWPQLKCLLWEHAPHADGPAPSWEAVATTVNAKCIRSAPQAPDAYRAAYATITRAMPDFFAGDAGDGAGQRAWVELLYGQAQRLFGRPRFMNLGYAGVPDAALPLALAPADEPYRFAIQLYHQLLDQVGIRGRHVLEVGCGGGGGLDFIRDYLAPASVAGVDVVADNVAGARRSQPPHDVRVASAEQLPFDDASVDVVVCVESSEHYRDIAGFFAEARRVLRPGGALLLADLRWNGSFDGHWGASRSADALRGQLPAAGFDVVRFDDITPNVLRSIELQDAGKRAAVDHSGLAGKDAEQFAEIMLCMGSRNHQMMRRGELVYLSTVATVPR